VLACVAMNNLQLEVINGKVAAIVLLKNKLITIDAVLPILMELDKRYSSKMDITLVFPNEATFRETNKNVHIKNVVTNLRANYICLRGRGRIAYIIAIVKLILIMLFRKTILIKFSNNSFFYKQKPILAYIKKISAYIDIYAHLGVPSKEFRQDASDVLRSNKGINSFAQDEDGVFGDLNSFDYIMTSMPREQMQALYDIFIPDEKIIYTGYFRSYPSWLDYVEQERKTYPAINGGEYFLFILTTLGRRLADIDEPPMIELLEESLAVLKKFNNKIHTIFKPHPVTDLNKFNDVLSRIGYKNYSIDYGHPMILSTKAKFVVGNLFSTAMVDSYYLGCPTIEYCQYDPRVNKILNNRSHGQGLCDFFIPRNAAKLESIVLGILNNEIAISRDAKFLSANYPPMPVDFFKLWDTCLGIPKNQAVLN
jgi:hypothetical protein